MWLSRPWNSSASKSTCPTTSTVTTINSDKPRSEEKTRSDWPLQYRRKKIQAPLPTQGNPTASHIQGSYTNAAGYASSMVDNSQKAFGEQKQLLKFHFLSAATLKGATGEYAPLITMGHCRFWYDNTRNNSRSSPSKDKTDWLLQEMALNVSVGSRIAILGKNGAGKSTLVKLLCGELLLDAKVGSFHRNANLKIAHISQHHIEHLGSYLEQSSVGYFLTKHSAKNE